MMMKTRIPYTKPSITELEVRYAADAAANGWGEKCYDYIERFEKIFCQYFGVSQAIATSSCTGALHIGLSALGISPGDEVIIPDITWIASAAPIVYLGAKPVFVDILPDTWCIDPCKAEAAISEKTKAIIAVHLYGNLCDMDSLSEIAKRNSLFLVEDAAEAIGAKYHEKYAGTMGKFGVFSFHGTKTITTGEGGMFVTDDELLWEQVLTLSNHGRNKLNYKQFWSEKIGFKYKMSNIQAAIGCAQMERIDEILKNKRKILDAYRELLAPMGGVDLNPESPGCLSGAWMPTVVFDAETGITREKIQAAFQKQNIDARIFFWPLSSLPMFDKKDNPIAYDISARAFNLPSYPDMTQDEIEQVADVIRGLLHA